jgi:hypothetical protein
MPATPRATFTEHQKYMILVRQSFRCKGVPNYTCPLQGRHFDEAGYDIDHIQPLFLGGSNDPANLQALCPSCHRVKTIAEQKERTLIHSTTSYSPPTTPLASTASSVASTTTSESKQEVEDRCATKLVQDFCRNTNLSLIRGEVQTATGEKIGTKHFYERFRIWFEKNRGNYSKYPQANQVAKSQIIIRKNTQALLRVLHELR